MRRLAILVAGAALFGAVSAQADQVTSATLGGGLEVGNTFQPGAGSLTRFTDTAAAGVGADGPFVSVMGSTSLNGTEALGTDARLNWDFEVLGPPTGQVDVVITGTYDGSVTSATGGVVGNVFVGPGLSDLTTAFHAECDANNHGQCGQHSFSVIAPVLIGSVNVIEIQVGGGNGVYSASIDPMISLAPGLADQGYTLEVEPDALPPANTGGVPEPAAWTLMIAGFGIAGAGLRRRRMLTA